MNETCSLDFLGKEKFDVHIISADGKQLFSSGDKITPEILLSLYFKEFTVKSPIKTPGEIEEDRKRALAENPPENFEEYLGFFDEFINLYPENLKFDKPHAEKIKELSYSLGSFAGMSNKALEELKLAAYFYKIGVIKLKEEDSLKPDFLEKAGEIGYNLLSLSMKIPKEVAVTTRDYLVPYDVSMLDIKSSKISDIPYSHIVSIVDYYCRLIDKKGLSKEEALQKMLQLGSNKFNTFILHKFIKKMRDSND